LDYAAGTEAAYVAVEENASLLDFAGGLVDAIGAHAEGIERTLTGAHARSLQMPDPPAALAGWFVRHLRPEPLTIVVDDLHHARDGAVAAFVAHAIDASPAACKWIVASESLDDLPVARWLAHETAAYPISHETLCLTIREALAAALFLSPSLTIAQVESLLARCGGIPSQFAFSAAVLGKEPGKAFEGSLDVAAAFAKLNDAERRAVLVTSLLPALDAERVLTCAGAETLAIVEGLRAAHPFLFEWDGSTYHSYVRPHLIAQLNGSACLRAAVAGTAKVYERDGDIARALRLLGTTCDEAEILAILERRGFASLDRDAAHGLRDAVRTLSPEARAKSPAVLTLLALTAALEGHGDVCESLFQNAMVACTSERDRWFVRYRYGAELIRRDRGADALALLDVSEGLEDMPVPFRACVEAALAVAHAVSGSLDAARDHCERGLALIRLEPDRAAEARVCHQASYVALATAKYERAKELADRSARLAHGCGLAEVEAGALSVLYNVLADVDDDAAGAAEVLHRIALCGGKAGSIELQFYGLVGAYELEVERGDQAALAPLEASIRDFEVHYGEPIAMQGLLPSQVLQLAWEGAFARAWCILKPGATDESDPVRRAQRWSEMAVYAACAGDAESAAAALAEVRACARDCDAGSARMQRVATMWSLSLVLLGKCRAGLARSRRLLATIPRERHRARAFARAVESLAAWRLGEVEGGELLARIGELYERDLGGVARLFESLPPACVTPLAELAAAETAA
jgi:ATP/maltotriose-dependent transcriptional regulator MalT